MSNLAFAKLVATPTDTSWSQVYNAGNLFASLSLLKKEEDESVLLQSIGKDFFSSIEAEFFTLEEKNLNSIKDALLVSIKDLPENIIVNLCLAYFKENVLYLFIYGGGTIMIKRGSKIGVLLHGVEGEEIVTSSGFLQTNDTVILQTPQFAEDMPIDNVTSSLDLKTPEDIAEALSPTMHEKDDGGQAAIIVNYKGEDELADEETDDEEVPVLNERIANEDLPEVSDKHIATTVEEETFNTHQTKKINFPKIKLPVFWKTSAFLGLNHRKKLFLSVAIILVSLLVFSIFLTKKKQDDTKTAVLFESIYTPALKDYEDGIEIKSINSAFAREDFLKAESTLKNGSDKFKKGSKEEKQISELLTKVQSELGTGTFVTKINPKEVSLDSDDFLSIEKANSSGIAFTKGADVVYFITDDAVISVDNSGSKKDTIKNDDDWEKPVGLSFYQGNIFVLDQKNGVLKYVAGSDGFGKNSYFKDKPDMGSAKAIAIDGSVWILFADGNISKYTKGVADPFKISALDKPFNKPTKIVTDLDTDNLYILDSGNSRIVKLSKSGNFGNQYSADILKSAKDFEISEKDGKIVVFSQNKFFEIKL